MQTFAAFFAMFFVAQAILTPESVPLSVTGLMGETPVIIGIEWDDSWFGNTPSNAYNHGMARAACVLSDVAYTDAVNDVKGNALVADYRLLGIADDDIMLHYDVDYSNDKGNDQCAFSIASKTLHGREGTHLVFVVVRGTPLSANEWLSNMNINDDNKTQSDLHLGFSKAASLVRSALYEYAAIHSIDTANTFLLVTGHSRGGAIANALGASLLSDGVFNPNNMYVYTFASPNVTTDIDSNGDKYGFIWNIVNSEDIITAVPPYKKDWAYRKYGRIKTFINAATEKTAYESCLFDVRRYYKMFTGRDYHPFNAGPFWPIVITAWLTSIKKSVDDFYSGFLNMHDALSSMLSERFVEKTSGPGNMERWFYSWLDHKRQGLSDYLPKALFDMHYASAYLAFLLALDEQKAFSCNEYRIAVVHGSADFAVTNSTGEVSLRVIDNRIDYSSIKPPIVAAPSPDGGVFIGFPPCAGTFTLTDETLFPTKFLMHLELFTSDGVCMGSTEDQSVYLRRQTAYSAYINEVKTNDVMVMSIVQGGKAKELVQSLKIDSSSRFFISPEFNLDTNMDFQCGFHAGNQRLYGTALAGRGQARRGHTFEFAAGVGNKQSIISSFAFDTEALMKFIWGLKSDNGNKKFAAVPEIKASLSMQVIGSARIFVATALDFRLDGCNDAAFDSEYRGCYIPHLDLGPQASVAPSLQFGLRF